MSEQVPNDVSQKLQDAIEAALIREKAPKGIRLTKSLFAVLIILIVFLIIFQLIEGKLIAAFLMSAIAGLGIVLHNRPQPRLQIAGVWNSWIYSKLLLSMVFLMGAELLICPHFALVDRNHSMGLSFFESIRHQFMEWGGMQGCMFLCGLTFAGVAALLAFASIAKTLYLSSKIKIIHGIGWAALSLAPLLVLQFFEEHMRPYIGYWFLGAILGITSSAVLITSVYWIVTRRTKLVS